MVPAFKLRVEAGRSCDEDGFINRKAVGGVFAFWMDESSLAKLQQGTYRYKGTLPEKIEGFF
eukprot:6783005-Alexandrium_andersonii.AAC.1